MAKHRKTDNGAHNASEKPRRKPGRPPRFTEADREQAHLAYLSGDTPAEIARVLGCSARTVRGWARKHRWHEELADRRQTPYHLENQIARLSKGPMTDSKAQRIAMLTRALERMRRAAPKAKPRPIVREARSQDLLAQVTTEEYGLYPYQRDLITSEARFRCVLKSRQIGFSYALALDALLAAAAGRNQIILSASQEQSDILIEYALQHANRLGLALDATAKSELTLGSTVIRALPANQRTVQGFNGDLILDEFAWQQNQRRIWRAVYPSITAVGGRVTVCSTPFVPGTLFWEIATNHKRRWSQWEHRTITIHDAVAQGMHLPGGIEELRANLDSESWALMYECQWAEDGTALLSWDLLEQLSGAGNDPITERRVWDGPVWIGVDVGRINDRTAIAVVGYDPGAEDGYRLLFHEEHRGMEFSEQRALIQRLFSAYHVRRLRIDRTGMGMQLAEEITNSHPQQAQGLHFTRERKERMALNLLKLAEDRRLALPRDPDLFARLHAVKRSATATGQIRYDAARDETGHADTFWALAMAVDGLARNEAGSAIVEVW